MSKDLKEKTFSELEKIVTELGQKKFLAGYIFNFIHEKNASEISQISPLSKSFREQLVNQGYIISKLTLAKKLTSQDKTAKYLFTLEDGKQIETVLLHDGKRKTLCISTQVGCDMNCLFCATGRIKFKRNLSAGEIVDQVNSVEADAGKISNIVYMGMGEALLNYDSVTKSVRILNHAKGKNIGIRHLTVSTCGIVPGIKKLAKEELHPRLAVSLNAPEDELRTKLMPVNAKYPLDDLFKAIRLYQDSTRRRITFEYILLDEVNDSPGQARQLAHLVAGLNCHINLIAANKTLGDLRPSNQDKILAFAEELKRLRI